MNGRLPIEGQKVQVKLTDGEWQDAVYRESNFVDHYGLPLYAGKISEWRELDETPTVNGESDMQRSSANTVVSPTH